MKTEYVVALIGIGGPVLGASIALIGKLVKKSPPGINPKHTFRQGKVAERFLDYHEAVTHFENAAEEHKQLAGSVNLGRAQALVEAGRKHYELAEYDVAIQFSRSLDDLRAKAKAKSNKYCGYL